MDTMTKQQIYRTSDGRNGGEDACRAWGYCYQETHQVVVFQNVQPQGSCECRWPVCDKHAKAFYFRHLGVPVHFEPKDG
jgi:hypothetical protein